MIQIQIRNDYPYERSEECGFCSSCSATDILTAACLGIAGFLHQSGEDWHWIDEAYPADTIGLRSVTSDNFVSIDKTGEDGGRPEVIGEVDFSSALTTVHPKAIYIHQGQQYHVEILDFNKPILNRNRANGRTSQIYSVHSQCFEHSRSDVSPGRLESIGGGYKFSYF